MVSELEILSGSFMNAYTGRYKNTLYSTEYNVTYAELYWHQLKAYPLEPMSLHYSKCGIRAEPQPHFESL